MKSIDAHADALRSQQEAWNEYNKAIENAQRASIKIFECRMKNTYACHCCEINVELTKTEMKNALDEVYRTGERVSWLHAILLMDPEYLKWISTS
jgi:hypothetical protein